MFGIGAQEMVIIGLLALAIFGAGRLPQVARDLGGFVQKARATTEGFKTELGFGEPTFGLHPSSEHSEPEHAAVGPWNNADTPREHGEDHPSGQRAEQRSRGD